MTPWMPEGGSTPFLDPWTSGSEMTPAAAFSPRLLAMQLVLVLEGGARVLPRRLDTQGVQGLLGVLVLQGVRE